MQTHTTKLTDIDLQVGGGVEPGEVPEAARMMRTMQLRDLGLPFRCDGGKIVEDRPTESSEDIDEDDDDREARVVLFKLGGECMSVEYTRPIDIAITSKFDPWPEEDEVLVTLYDEDRDGAWHMRTVGEASPIH
jgi:hypothetical protein